MSAPHAWSAPVKRFVVTGATLVVILMYMFLCVAGGLMVSALPSLIRP